MDIDFDLIDEELKRKEIIRLAQAESLEKIREELRLPFHLRIQLKHNLHQLKRVEETQETTLNNIIKKREELKHLQGQEKELMAQFFTAYLNGEVVSLNDFFYVDRLNLEKGLKKEFVSA